MNVTTVTATKREAQDKIRAYRNRLKRAADDEYSATLKAYEEIEKGKALIDLRTAFAEAGLFFDGRPRLAIARADRKEVWVDRYDKWDGRFVFCAGNHRRSVWKTRHSYPDLITEVWTDSQIPFRRGYTLVPMIPADIRETCKKDLGKLRVLWEVEEWSGYSLGSGPPRDPFLLSHLAGSLYVIEAAWDLTEIERLIMTGRREA